MKKIITSFFLLCFFALGAMAQGNFTITGTVTDTLGGPVVNQQVCIYTDSMQTSFQYYNCIYTNNQGYFSVVIPGGSVPGPNVVFNLSTQSCNTYLTQQVQNNQGTTIGASVSFVICGGSALACSTYIMAIPDSGGIPFNYFLYGYSMQGGTIATTTSYSWDFGDGSPLSTQAAPQHVYAPGNYTACLTTTTSSGCISSACTNFVVNAVTSCNAQYGYQSTGAGNATYFNALFGANYNYLWTFGDGTSGTGQFPIHTYTTAGTYTVCLVVVDSAAGCSDNVCYNVTIQGGQANYYLYGQVSLPGSGMLTAADYGQVFLIRQNGLILTAIDTTTIDSAGYYFFPTVTAGSYLVKAALDSNSAFYSYYMPTYHSSSLFWNSATTVVISNASAIANIAMIAGVNPGGPGFIGGSVLQGANRMASPGDPIVGITILLLDMSNNPIASTTTDVNGNYSFSNIAFGTYQVYAEQAGKTTVPSIVTIDIANPTVNNVNVEVNSGNILAVKTIEAKELAFGLYPNPARESITITVDAIESSNVTIEIANNLGQVVQRNEYKLGKGKQNVTESLTNLSKGVYAISVVNNNQRNTTKFVKAE